MQLLVYTDTTLDDLHHRHGGGLEGCIIVVLHLDRAAAQAEHQHFVLEQRAAHHVV